MRAKILLSALAVTVLSGTAFAGTYDYFKIHAKNITPVYTSETIQIEGATEVQTPQAVQPAVQNLYIRRSRHQLFSLCLTEYIHWK